jgi:hypothetical protein
MYAATGVDRSIAGTVRDVIVAVYAEVEAAAAVEE